jgi:hypothetical protein
MKERPDLDVVLEELYALDPALRSQAPSIRKLAEELLAAKPDAAVDEAFVTRLRLELKARIASRPSTNPFVTFFTMPTNKYLVPGLAILAIAVIGAATLSTLQRPSVVSNGSGKIAYEPSVERVDAGAFGSLVGQPGGARPESGGGGAMGLGAGAPQTSSPTAAALPPMAGGSVASDKMLVAPDYTPTIYAYTYKGEALTGLSPQVDVYLRTRNVGAAPVGALTDYDLGLMNLAAAKGASVQSFSIAESREDGYIINVNPEEGTINMYENYLTWTYPERACADEACFNSYRLKESDMIADEESIRIADAFLAEYGVSKDGYGAPTVRAEWRAQYLAAADKSNFWFPDVVTVIYPQVIDGKPVYDEGGAPYGLNVNVNVRHKRAAGLWNLSTRNFQVSSYAGETDAAVLIGLAEKGGVYGDQWMPEGAKVVQVELGTPQIAFSRVWQWNGSIGNELTVPTLVFPVLNAPQDFWRTNVTIPLAKELLQPPKGGGGVPMPVDAVAPAVR